MNIGFYIHLVIGLGSSDGEPIWLRRIGTVSNNLKADLSFNNSRRFSAIQFRLIHPFNITV